MSNVFQGLEQGMLGANNGHNNTASFPRAVEFAEKDILPGGKAQSTVDEGDGLTGANQPRFEVGVCVAILPVMLPYAVWD